MPNIVLPIRRLWKMPRGGGAGQGQGRAQARPRGRGQSRAEALAQALAPEERVLARMESVQVRPLVVLGAVLARVTFLPRRPWR